MEDLVARFTDLGTRGEWPWAVAQLMVFYGATDVEASYERACLLVKGDSVTELGLNTAASGAQRAATLAGQWPVGAQKK